MPLRPALLAALLLLLGAASAAAQPEPPRPALPRGADPNDWEAYFELADSRFRRAPSGALAAFYWASRVDPTRAEPVFARWAAFFNRDRETWFGYLLGDPRVLGRADVVRNDSLLHRALDLNPFVHRGLEVRLYLSLGSGLGRDPAMVAFTRYADGDFREAAEAFGRLVRASPERNVHLRHWRALSLLGAGDLHGAAAEIEALLAALRRAEAEQVAGIYRSKARFEFALGLLHEARGQPAAARAAYERALVEDLASVPPRGALARLALREGRSADAVRLLTEAVEIAPDDAVMHFELGAALVAGGRREEALAAFRRASVLEPHWAAPYLHLGGLLDGAGDRAGAEAAFRMFLERAPRSEEALIARVRARLGAGGG